MKRSSGPRRTASNLSESIHRQLGKYAIAVVFTSLLFLTFAPTALASTTLYVDGVNGNDNNDCKSRQHACKTIGHAISLASSGDSILVGAATYTENLTIAFGLKLIGSGAATTIVDGGGVNTVVTISSSTANVTLSKMTIRNGHARYGGGIYNNGALTINSSTISGNTASGSCGMHCKTPGGGGIFNTGALKINNSTVSGNSAGGWSGGGIWNNGGTLTINNSTVSGNGGAVAGGGIVNTGPLTINNSTVSGNSSGYGGGIFNTGALTINNSTVSGNSSAGYCFGGGGILNYGNLGTVIISNSTISGNSADINGSGIRGAATLENSVVANSPSGGNCSGTMTSNGYNLSSDNTCNFNNTGDLNNTDPKLGTLRNNGGPTQTQALLSGSPAIDGGNPGGCTDSQGHLLKTDQRGKPRPDKEDTGGCDMGAYERQKDELKTMDDLLHPEQYMPLKYQLNCREPNL